MKTPHNLGASLYVPATRNDLIAIANGEKQSELRSIIFCTEDAVGQHDLPEALDNLKKCLKQLKPIDNRLRYIRVRNPTVLNRILEMPKIERIDGFVLPKVSQPVLGDYLTRLADSRFQLMVTLETLDVFDCGKMAELRDYMLEQPLHECISALRIGGNDLLNLLGIRRPRDRTIYQTPLGVVIANLVTIFKPYGFNLTAPVFEHLNNEALLREEIEADLAHGLIGKTAIHPSQVPIIESFYRVDAKELDAARTLLKPDAAAVFRLHDSMCEVATHQDWAKETVERAAIYGVESEERWPVDYPMQR